MKNTNTEKNSTVTIGIDPSFTGTGIIALQNKEIIGQDLFSTKPKEDIEQRIMSISKKIFAFCYEFSNPIIYMEGIAFAKKSTFAHQLGALHFYIRILFYRNNDNYTIVPPTELKKFVTGKGNCKKDLMLMKTYKRWGVEFDDDNLCDAFCLAQYATSKIKIPLRKRR